MSRFVSAGAIQEGVSPDAPVDEWTKAREELEIKRAAKESQPKVQDGGKSLYEVLQANKAAKQEKHEEALRLKNQFRSLDDDEIDFLDSVLESTRAKDDAIRQETREQLEQFRNRQGDVSALDDAAEDEPEESWTLKRKRKKPNTSTGLRGLKLRKSSSTAADSDETPSSTAVPKKSEPQGKAAVSKPEVATSSAVPSGNSRQQTSETNRPELKVPRDATREQLPKPRSNMLGVGDYSSSSDNDDD